MYWSRAILKRAAKEEMRRSFWLYLGAMILPGLVIGLVTFLVGILSGILGFIMPRGVGILLSLLPTYLVMFLVSLPLSVGQCNVLIRAPYGEREIGNLFFAFRSEHYWSIVKTMFFTVLYIFLWSLLLVIPGIVKAYQYSMVSYIICENPELKPREALDISREMTSGEKFDMFVLDLSFMGWGFLAGLACVVVMMILGFISPALAIILAYLVVAAAGVVLMVYMRTTYAQLYYALRYKYFNQQNPSGPQPYGGAGQGGYPPAASGPQDPYGQAGPANYPPPSSDGPAAPPQQQPWEQNGDNGQPPRDPWQQ